MTALSVPHPAAFLQALLTSNQGLRSWYMLLFQLPFVPESQVSSVRSMERALRSTGMPPDSATRDAGLMGDREAARGALNWYRALVFAGPRALRAKSRVPTLHVWSDGDAAIGPKGPSLSGRYVEGPYTYEVLEGVSHWIPDEVPERLAVLLGHHFDAFGVNGG